MNIRAPLEAPLLASALASLLANAFRNRPGEAKAPAITHIFFDATASNMIQGQAEHSALIEGISSTAHHPYSSIIPQVFPLGERYSLQPSLPSLWNVERYVLQAT